MGAISWTWRRTKHSDPPPKPGSTQKAQDALHSTSTHISMLPRRVRSLHIEAAEDETSGGSHRSLHDLVTGLERFGISPTVLFNQDNPFVGRLRTKGVDVHVWDRIRREERKALARLPSPLRLLPAAHLVLRRVRFLRKQSIDVVHLNNSPFAGYTDWLPASWILGIPCIASMRGDATGSPTRRQLKIFRGYARVIPVSQYVARSPTCRALGSERVAVIPNGVDLERLQAATNRSSDAKQLRRELGVSSPQMILAVMAGTIRRWKGQLNVLKALTHLDQDDLQRLKLVFAGGWGPGDQEYVDEIKSLARAESIRHSVRFLGHRQDVPNLFAAADVAVHASTTPEPFGLVVAEALATGTPVVAARSGGPMEILSEGGGMLHDPTRPEALANCLAELISRPELRIRLAREAHRVGSRFSIDRTRSEFARLFQTIVTPNIPGRVQSEV